MVAASGFSAIALNARPTFDLFNKTDSPATIRIENTRLNNCGIDIMNPPILQSKLEKAVENPRVSEP